MNDQDLEHALRNLPRREGSSDWTDLQSRLSALRPPRPRRHPLARFVARRHILSAMAALALVVGGIATWMSRTAAPETAWQEAHVDATLTDPWADPWVVAAVESSR